MASSENRLLGDIYKPKTLEETRLPQRVLNLLESKAAQIGTTPNFKLRLLLYGTAGTGKTTTARIIAKVHKMEALYLSGSNDFNIDKMRNQVYPFCNSFSTVTGTPKLLIIDEYERIRPAIQDAFKILLDQTKVHVILITNHVDDIIPEIHSRMTKVDYNFTGLEINEQKTKYAQFIGQIINEQKIVADGPGLEGLFKQCFPDFRKLIEILQQFKDTNQPLTLENISHLIVDGNANVDLYEILRIVDDAQFFLKASEYKGREQDVFMSLGNPFFQWLNNQGLYKKTILSAVVVGNWGNKLHLSPNKWVALFACLSELRAIMLK